jgi:hypothetical protein
MPFFYWYQMAWVPISVLLTVIVYRATTRPPVSDERRQVG